MAREYAVFVDVFSIAELDSREYRTLGSMNGFLNDLKVHFVGEEMPCKKFTSFVGNFAVEYGTGAVPETPETEDLGAVFGREFDVLKTE